MHPRVDIVRPSTPIGSAATTGSRFPRAMARTLLDLEKPMRFTTARSSLLARLAILVTLTSLFSACVGEIGSPRKPGREMEEEEDDDGAPEECEKVERDVLVRRFADMSSLPQSGCYDIYGRLVLEGSEITSLQALKGLNSVDELEVRGTQLTRIDTQRPVGIYGKLTVTSNPRLVNLQQLSFETAAAGVVISGNPALLSVEPLSIDTPRLEEVAGDIDISDNAVLASVPLKNLIKVSGNVRIMSNAAIRTVDLSKLATTGRIEIAANAQLSSLTGLVAQTINGDLAIRDNPVLGTLGTMSALQRVAGALTIDNNSALGNLGAFTTNVKFVDRALTIRNNQNLTDLGALKRLQAVESITVTNNRNLVACRAIELDRCTRHVIASVINNNGTTNCNWQCD
jgi:Receptor L domain